MITLILHFFAVVGTVKGYGKIARRDCYAQRVTGPYEWPRPPMVGERFRLAGKSIWFKVTDVEHILGTEEASGDQRVIGMSIFLIPVRYGDENLDINERLTLEHRDPESVLRALERAGFQVERGRISAPYEFSKE